MKQLVKLRIKKLAKGQGSYYLDWHVAGHRNYEYLGLYVDLEKKDRETLARNREIERVALQLRNAKEDELIYSGNNIKKPLSKNQDTIIDCINNSRRVVLPSVKNKIVQLYGDMPIAALTPRHVRMFVESCSNLQNVTRRTYHSQFRSILKKAVSNDLLPFTILDSIPPVPAQDKPVTYLTPAEITKMLNSSAWKYDENRRAFGFACLTGLRRSDIYKLTWEEVTDDNHLLFAQQKTQIDASGNAYAYTRLPLNAQALELLGERGEPHELVFNLPKRTVIAHDLVRVAKAEGLTKHVHFHITRHSYGVMLVHSGVDIFTVSKLLGHKSVSTTTKHYANISDEHATNSVNKLPKL